MKKLWFILSVFVGLQVFAQTADEIIKKADDIRNPSESYSMVVSLRDTDSQEESQFEVFLKGNDKTLIKTLAPKRDVGRDMLMLEENMWLYITNLKRSVRISLSQKLSGQAANGDISRMRWHGDYQAKMKGQDKKTWTIHLMALKKGLTYEQIEVKIEKKSFKPLSAVYLSLNGKPLKNVTFSDYKLLEGKNRPSRLVIADATNKNKVTNMVIQSMKKAELPDSLFNKNNFK